MPSAKVIVDDRFSRLDNGVERGVERALNVAAAATVAKAKEGGKGDYNIAPILDSIKASPPHRVRKGWRVFVYAEDFRAVFFERGTYSRRRGKLSPRYKRSPRAEKIAAERGTGVKPQRYLGAAVPVARAALIDALQAELGRLP